MVGFRGRNGTEELMWLHYNFKKYKKELKNKILMVELIKFYNIFYSHWDLRFITNTP